MKTKKLVRYLNEYLDIYSYQDYGPNGLQIEGSEEITKIAFAVSATKESIEKAIESKAQALIVHHGLFWKFHGVRTITKAFGNRVRPLIKNDINLLGYHLPLDAHMETGNAKSLADLLELSELKAFGDHKGMPTGVWGKFAKPLSAKALKDKIQNVCSRQVLVSANEDTQEIKSLGIITGGANGDWTHCDRKNIDAYLTGEMSEHDWHEAKESDVVMYAAGHHATEKFGIQNLMKHIESQFDVECVFFDSENPA